MNTAILFEETQGSGNKKTADFCKITTVIFAMILFLNLYTQHGEITELTTGLFTGFVLMLLSSILSYTKMVTQIRADGIYVRYPPFQPTFTKYEWEKIRDVYIRKYDAFSEYNGWGIKTSSAGKGYIVQGYTGLQLIIDNDQKILIGTQEPGAVLKTLQELDRVK